jgi:hypothetical protein
MTPFDFRAQVHDGDPLPLVETDFIFVVPAASSARVNADGINCGQDAIMQLISLANAVDLDVVNGAGTATITAWSFGSAGWQKGPPQSIPSLPGLQHVRFDFTGIGRITFTSRGELYLQMIR